MGRDRTRSGSTPPWTRSAPACTNPDPTSQPGAKRLRHDDFPIPQQFVDDLSEMTYHARTATAAASSDYLNQRTLPDRLTALGKPLLVIFGEQDRRWRFATSTAEYRTVPGATVVTMPGVGHSPLVEDPTRTAEILLSFTGIHVS
ncbi:alpha/beta fold hydrolase [Nocardia sp. NPDC049526]|uniref:alpha/beta fold hydrolase n=1 Tax=Nocardia sp. NPDC049526 TaxID=3364316 RepID=UPI0037BA0A64